MPFGKKKPGKKGRDPFGHLADDRREAESSAWFLEPDDGPELDVQTGVSSNLSEDDLEQS